MSATTSSVLFLIVYHLLLPFAIANPSTNPHNTHINNNNGAGNSGGQGNVEWFRNLETQLSRVVTRLDQLEIRLSRVQSLVLMRFDNIENGLTTSKLRIDLWGDELNRIEEQWSRKWKNFDSKFDSMVSSIDSKLESKLTQMQRDNRRHNEIITLAFNNVANLQDKLPDRVANSVSQVVNTSMHQLKNELKESSGSLKMSSTRMFEMLDDLSSRTKVNTSSSTSQYQLLGNKVTNMFEDLMSRSTSMETTLKEVMSLANGTRKDVHDGFRILIGSSQNNFNSQQQGRSQSRNQVSSSSEVMSAVMVEALASVDSMSTALGRKITEFSRSMDERFEIVSMSINGFLESCSRIQDSEPLIEDKIADLLIRIVDIVSNSTREASELWVKVAGQIMENRGDGGGGNNCTSLPSINTSSSSSGEDVEELPDGQPVVVVVNEDHLLSEEDKNSIWESLRTKERLSPST